MKQGDVMIRTWARSRLLVEARVCFFSFFFLIFVFSGFSDNVPVGAIASYCASDAPVGWLLCDGTVISTNDYPDLFAVIGYQFGGSGGTFKVPDLRGRVGVGLAASGTFDLLAKTGGLENVTLVINQIPSHSHPYSGLWYDSGPNAAGGAGFTWKWLSTENVGGGQPHENMPPYLVVNYIIKALPDESFFGDLEEIELWNLKVGLWMFGGLCAFVLSVCFFLRR